MLSNALFHDIPFIIKESISLKIFLDYKPLKFSFLVIYKYLCHTHNGRNV